MEVTAFVPARCGSKSIPFKNIKLFCGKPLIYWCLMSLENCLEIDRIIVATDCIEIEDVVTRFQFSKVSIYKRKKENAQDTSTSESVVLEYLNSEKGSCLDKEGILALIQATSPFTTSLEFTKAIHKFTESKCDSMLSVVKSKRFFWNNDGTPINYDFKNRPRRQDFEGILMENGAFYLNSITNFIENKNRLKGKIGLFELPEYAGVEIDENHDWIIAEKIMYDCILNREPITRIAKEIQLFLSDVDGVLTDSGMYYSASGEELKKFNTRDGMGFELLRKKGIKTGLITSEETSIVSHRAKKLKIDFLYQSKKGLSKLETAEQICNELGISLMNTAYIGDDINCKKLLENVGLAACPADAQEEIKSIPNIHVLKRKGGEGVVREFIELFLL